MRQLELVSTLADAGNMRAAAQRLNISTAAVSKGLIELEALFDVEIFQRLPRGVVPTPSGALIVQRARLLLNEVMQLSDDVAARRAGGSESLTIGAPPFIAWTLLPRLLRDMVDHGRAPSVRIVEGRLAEIGRQLEAGEIDALITMNAPSELGGLKLDGFRMEQVGSEQWTVVCAPDHPLARRSRPAVQSWKGLARADWILPPRPTNARIMAEQVMLKHGLAPIVPHIESTNAITNLQLTEQGLGITLVAMCVVEERLRRGSLIEVPMQDLPPAVPIVLVYRPAGAREEIIATLLAAAQRIRKADASVRSSSSARTRKLAARKSRS